MPLVDLVYRVHAVVLGSKSSDIQIPFSVKIQRRLTQLSRIIHQSRVIKNSSLNYSDFSNCTLITVLTQILFVTFFNLFVFHLQVDVVGPLLLNASLLLVQMTDYSD